MKSGFPYERDVPIISAVLVDGSPVIIRGIYRLYCLNTSSSIF